MSECQNIVKIFPESKSNIFQFLPHNPIMFTIIDDKEPQQILTLKTETIWKQFI